MIPNIIPIGFIVLGITLFALQEVGRRRHKRKFEKYRKTLESSTPSEFGKIQQEFLNDSSADMWMITVGLYGSIISILVGIVLFVI